MNLLLDSFWRAAAYCMHPRVIVLSVLPLVVMVGLTAGLGYFFWESALDAVRGWLDAFSFTATFWQWLEGIGFGQLKAVLAPLLVIFAVTPLIVVLSLLVVALLMTPALVGMVARRRFAGLEARHGASFISSLAWSMGLRWPPCWPC